MDQPKDPKLQPALASGNEVNANAPQTTPAPEKDDPQVEAVERAGGGGAPTTGAAAGQGETPFSPGEGVTEEQVERSGLDR